LEATYIYEDEQRELLFRVLRIRGYNGKKRFVQQRHDPSHPDGWVNGVAGVRKVPYRLREVLAASPDTIVFVPEGEECVERLRELGLAATTNPGGAGKWLEEYSDYLTGYRVVVLPDNDDAGRRHARSVAQSLLGKASEVRVLELPGLAPKGDIVDWLDAGGTQEGLLTLAKDAPVVRDHPFHLLPASEWFLQDLPQHGWIIEGLLPADSICWIAGRPKTMKTYLVTALAIAVAAGRSFCGQETRQGDVIVFDLEMPEAEAQRRGRLLAKGLGVVAADLSNLIFVREPLLRLDAGDHLAGLDRVLTEQKPALVIIDTFRRAHGADENSNTEVATLISGIRELQRRHRCCFLLVHHHGKADSSGTGLDLRGASDLAGGTDHHIGIYKPNAKQAVVQLRQEGRFSMSSDDLWLCLGEQHDGSLAWGRATRETPEPTEDSTSRLAREVRDVLARSAEARSRTWLREELGRSGDDINAALGHLGNEIENVGTDKRPRYRLAQRTGPDPSLGLGKVRSGPDGKAGETEQKSRRVGQEHAAEGDP